MTPEDKIGHIAKALAEWDNGKGMVSAGVIIDRIQEVVFYKTPDNDFRDHNEPTGWVTVNYHPNSPSTHVINSSGSEMLGLSKIEFIHEFGAYPIVKLSLSYHAVNVKARGEFWVVDPSMHIPVSKQVDRVVFTDGTVFDPKEYLNRGKRNIRV